MYSVVSLFAGIGGIDLGFKQAGFDIVWANEMDHAACKTYRHNLGTDCFVEGDIRNIDASVITKADVLTAGFSCQSYPGKMNIPKFYESASKNWHFGVKTSG